VNKKQVEGLVKNWLKEGEAFGYFATPQTNYLRTQNNDLSLQWSFFVFIITTEYKQH